MAAFWVLNRQFQQFIDSRFSSDFDSQMTSKYFVEYTRIEVKYFRDTLLQDMDADDAAIRPIYDEEPMAVVQLIDECNIFATGHLHTEQPEFNNE
ncbi:hypothetical protein Tco_1325237 [Tanacetum coccineum]